MVSLKKSHVVTIARHTFVNIDKGVKLFFIYNLRWLLFPYKSLPPSVDQYFDKGLVGYVRKPFSKFVIIALDLKWNSNLQLQHSKNSGCFDVSPPNDSANLAAIKNIHHLTTEKQKLNFLKASTFDESVFSRQVLVSYMKSA